MIRNTADNIPTASFSKQRCPKCGFSNDPSAPSCANCRAPLVQICPRCGAPRRWYVPTCPNCTNRTEDEGEFAKLFRDPPKGQLNKRYTILEVMNQGAVSALYRCQDSAQPGATVAIKEFQATVLFRAQERRSAEQAFWALGNRWQAAAHPTLTPILEMFAEGDRYYMVMPYLNGLSWQVLIADDRWRIAPSLAANWVAQLCQLLVYLEGQNEPLHLPFLAPQHVMVTMSGQIQLVDYGLKALFAPNQYGPYGSVAGYAAPELQQQPPSCASDIFSIGRLAYALLTGQQLNQGGKTSIPLRQVAPEITEGFARVLVRAAQRDLAKRFATGRELLQALILASINPDDPPIADWMVRALRSQHTANTRASTAHPAAISSESMADLGFEADPRFGRQASSKTTAPSKAVEAASRTPTVHPEPMLSISPKTISITEPSPMDKKRVVITLRNRGEGSIEGRLRSNLPLISAPSKAFTLQGGQTARAIVTVDTSQIAAGKRSEPQALAVETNAGRIWIALASDIASAPVLSITQPLLDYGILNDDSPQNLPLVIENNGSSTLNGRVSALVPWLNINKPEFHCNANASAQVVIGLQPDKLPAGQQNAVGALVVDSDGGQSKVTVCAWRQRPEYDLESSVIDLGSTVKGKVIEHVLVVGNRGDGALNGSARSLVPFLHVQPQQFSCPPGVSCKLTVTVDCVEMTEGLLRIDQALRLQSNAGTRSLGLRLEILAPRLKLSSAALDFGQTPLGQVTTRALIVRNEGSALLKAQVQPAIDWLDVSPRTLELQPGAVQTVQVTADTNRIGRGIQTTVPIGLRFTEDSGTITDIPASLAVLQPILSLDQERIDFGYLERTQSVVRQLVLSNQGSGNLAWQAQSSAVWLESSPSAGNCPAGDTQVITLTAYSLAFDQNENDITGTLIINSDGGRAKVELHAGIAQPLLATDTTLLELSSINDAPAVGSLRIFNHGLGDLNGTISSEQIWLVPERISFSCPTGRSIEVAVHTDPTELPPTAARAIGALQITSNGGASRVDVLLNVILCAELKPPAGKLEFKPTEDGRWLAKFTLQNIGKVTAHVSLSASPDALELNRSIFEIKPSKSVPVTLSWARQEPPGAGEASIEIVSEQQLFHVIS
ncbi:MAG: protein kinase [Chloroflexi bacterium]|nr:protein kinase [Chloroflexota bacterium]